MKKPAKIRGKRGWTLEVFSSFAEAEQADRGYWLSQTPERRMQALEQLRQMNHGYGNGKPELKFEKIIRIVKRAGI